MIVFEDTANLIEMVKVAMLFKDEQIKLKPANILLIEIESWGTLKTITTVRTDTVTMVREPLIRKYERIVTKLTTMEFKSEAFQEKHDCAVEVIQVLAKILKKMKVKVNEYSVDYKIFKIVE